MKIGIQLNEGASMYEAILDCARSIAAGYGAGTLTRKEPPEGFEDDDYLGFWSSIPDNTIKYDLSKYDLIIDIPKDMEDNDYLVAGIVRRKAKEYQT